MSSMSLFRGTVVKCNFPFDVCPNKPGPKPHYCLYMDSVACDGKQYVAVAYGTSRLDTKMMDSHQGLILSVPANCISGSIPSMSTDRATISTHFIADHIALLEVNAAWIYPNFSARLDFIREEKRHGDMRRQRLFHSFEYFEKHCQRSANEAITLFLSTKRVGLPQGKVLR